MCVAAPGRVVKIEGTTAVVDYNGNTVKASTGVVSVKEGDYALVHAGLIIQVLKQEEAESMAELFKEIEELSDV